MSDPVKSWAASVCARLPPGTLDDVARQAGITKGTIYLYFPSKAALFTAMLKTRITAVIPSTEPRTGRAASSLEGRLAAIGQDIYRFLSSPAYLAMFRTVVGEVAQFPEIAAQVYREGILVANRRFAAVIRAAIRSGEFRDVDAMIAARAFIGMFLIFAVSQRLLGGERIYPIADDAVVKTVTEIFLNGLRPRTAPEGDHRPRHGRRPSALRRGAAPVRTTADPDRSYRHEEQDMSGANGRKRMRIAIVVVVAGLLASGAALWRWWQRPPEGVLVASGTIEATEIAVSFKIPGRVIARPADEGQRVNAGDPVATLESKELEADVGRLRASLGHRDAPAAAPDRDRPPGGTDSRPDRRGAGRPGRPGRAAGGTQERLAAAGFAARRGRGPRGQGRAGERPGGSRAHGGAVP
jgi:AcrR family transcriptional regulator